jgi:hypothetical protein
MNENPANTGKTSSNDEPPLHPWSECDFFCFQNYAVTGASPWGWRGKLHEVDASGTTLLCPRCSHATLFRIPLQS